MNKIAMAAMLLAVSATTAEAKNLKAEVALDHDLWWNAPENPVLNLTLTDTLTGSVDSRLRVCLTPDTAQSDVIFQREYNLSSQGPSTLSVDIPAPAPGFYRCYITDDGNLIKETVIGYEPLNVVSLPDSKPDFNDFWRRAKAELAEIPADYTMKLLPELSGKKRNVYLCTFRSWGGDTIKAHVAIPVNPGRYPAIVYFNGYGAQPWNLDADGNPDWIEMQTSVRGQFYCQDGNKYGDWIRYNLDNPDRYYYKGAYLDALRAVDILQQLPEADTTRLYAEGGSQGGALTLAAAALADGRLRAIAPYIPFMSDFPDYFRIVSWPATPVNEARQALGMSERQMYDNLTYFDIKNFARRIKCPVLMGIGLQDPTCPPHTNLSSYNLITTPKELIIYPTCGHTVDYADWNPRRTAFFNKY